MKKRGVADWIGTAVFIAVALLIVQALTGWPF